MDNGKSVKYYIVNYVLYKRDVNGWSYYTNIQGMYNKMIGWVSWGYTNPIIDKKTMKRVDENEAFLYIIEHE